MHFPTNRDEKHQHQRVFWMFVKSCQIIEESINYYLNAKLDQLISTLVFQHRIMRSGLYYFIACELLDSFALFRVPSELFKYPMNFIDQWIVCWSYSVVKKRKTSLLSFEMFRCKMNVSSHFLKIFGFILRAIGLFLSLYWQLGWKLLNSFFSHGINNNLNIPYSLESY